MSGTRPGAQMDAEGKEESFDNPGKAEEGWMPEEPEWSPGGD